MPTDPLTADLVLVTATPTDLLTAGLGVATTAMTDLLTAGMVLVATAAALVSMAAVAWIDQRRFEIDPGWLCIATAASLLAGMLIGGIVYLPGALVAGALSGGVMWLAVWLRPGRIGLGDIGLFAALGLIAGPDDLPLAMAVAIVLVLLTGFILARVRGRPLNRTMIPLGPPVMAALAPVLALRTVGGLWPVPALPPEFEIPLVAVTATGLTCLGLLASARLRREPFGHH